MARGAWPDGVECWNNQRVRTPPDPQPWGEVSAPPPDPQPFDCAQGGGKLAPPEVGGLGGPLFDKIAS